MVPGLICPTVALHARRGRGGRPGEGPIPQRGMMIPNGTVKIASTPTIISMLALGPKTTAKTGTTVPRMLEGGGTGATAPRSKTSTRVLLAIPSYSALGGRLDERGRRAPASGGGACMMSTMLYNMNNFCVGSVKAPRRCCPG